MHPNWTGRLEDGSDIALVRLRGVSVNQPVPLAIRTNALVNVNAVTALGWGGTSDGESAENLQITNNLRLLENKYCDDEIDGWGDIIQESMICTSGLREGLDTCEGVGTSSCFSDSCGDHVDALNRRMDVHEFQLHDS